MMISRTEAKIGGARRWIFGIVSGLRVRATVRRTTRARRREATGELGDKAEERFSMIRFIPVVGSASSGVVGVRRYLPAARMEELDMKVYVVS